MLTAFVCTEHMYQTEMLAAVFTLTSYLGGNTCEHASHGNRGNITHMLHRNECKCKAIKQVMKLSHPYLIQMCCPTM